MPESGGEVTVRDGGQVTVLDAPDLDGEIWVDLDYDEGAQVRVPADTDVSFNHPDGALATDGGEEWAQYGARRVSSRGWSLREDHASIALAGGVLGLIGGGALLASPSPYGIAGLLLTFLGCAAAYVGARSRWSGTIVDDDQEVTAGG